ncbi:MAG: esterase, partial [Prevotella sp.]
MKQQIFIHDRQCTVFQNGEHPRMLLIQPVDGHDLEELDMELGEISSKAPVPFRFIAVHID